MDEPVIVADQGNGVYVVTMNRPGKRNALNADSVGALHGALADVAADRSCRVVVLTGTSKGFCSGLDLSGYGDLDATTDRGYVQAGFEVQRHLATLISRLRALPQPVIAAVNGGAIGGGLGVVLGCDVRIAGVGAIFSAAPIRIGLSACDMGISWLLPRLVGAGRAHEMMLTGREFGAREALELGLLTSVVEDAIVVEKAVEIARSITAHSPFGVAMTKQVMWSSLEAPNLQVALDLEDRTQVLAAQTADFREARRAYAERRRPVFTDR